MTTIARLTPQARIAAAALTAIILGIVGLIALVIAGAPTRTTAATPPIIIMATPTLAPAQPIGGFFDYRDAATGTTLDANTIACIDGTTSGAPGMVLAVVADCDTGARVWVREVDVPAAVGVRSLADLAPQPTAPPQPTNAPFVPVVGNWQPEQAPPPAPDVAPPTAGPEVLTRAEPADTPDRAPASCDSDPAPLVCSDPAPPHPPLTAAGGPHDALHQVQPSIRPGGPNSGNSDDQPCTGC